MINLSTEYANLLNDRVISVQVCDDPFANKRIYYIKYRSGRKRMCKVDKNDEMYSMEELKRFAYEQDQNAEVFIPHPKLPSKHKTGRMKCEYCGCISNKDSGTCEHCGGVLTEVEA